MRTFFFKILVVILVCKLLPNHVVGQQFYRVKADFSIKEKQAAGGAQLIMGTVFYDRSVKKVIYQIRFPKVETWIIDDTTLYKIAAKKVISKQRAFVVPDQSIFHYALSGQLATFGLRNSIYKIEKVEKEGNKVISTWQPDARMKKSFGKVVLSNIDKKLDGMVIYNKDNVPINKQFFKSYINQGGCEFPQEITQITQVKSGRNIQVTTYKNIVIDEKGEKTSYNIVLPK